MSYNYLPLDKKRLHFQQVKNLLDFEQLVSITFGAHEDILANAAFIKTHIHSFPFQPFFSAVENNGSTNEKLPLPIVKLMLMLKIKSISYGKSGVEIETVKTMMDIYNNGNIPDVLLSDAEPLQPLLTQIARNTDLLSHEEAALLSGNQFKTAVALYCLIKIEKLLTTLSGDKTETTFDGNFKALFVITKDIFSKCVQHCMMSVNQPADGIYINANENQVVTDHLPAQAKALDGLLAALFTALHHLSGIYNTLPTRELYQQNHLLISQINSFEIEGGQSIKDCIEINWTNYVENLDKIFIHEVV